MDDTKLSAKIFKALGDENRWQILEILRSGEKCACYLLNKLEISQSTLSHHIAAAAQGARCERASKCADKVW